MSSSNVEQNQQPSKVKRSGESFKVKLTQVNQLSMNKELPSVCGAQVIWEAGEVIMWLASPGHRERMLIIHARY